MASDKPPRFTSELRFSYSIELTSAELPKGLCLIVDKTTTFRTQEVA
jgi:hypothetical protein